MAGALLIDNHRPVCDLDFLSNIVEGIQANVK